MVMIMNAVSVPSFIWMILLLKDIYRPGEIALSVMGLSRSMRT